MSHDHAIHPATGTVANPRPARASAAPRSTDKNKDNPWYVRGLRPVENELDVFLRNDFVWLGY